MTYIIGVQRSIKWFLPKMAVLFVLGALLAGCGTSTPAETPTQNQPDTEVPATATVELVEPTPTSSISDAPMTFNNRNVAPPNLAQDASDLVSASGNCVSCHTQLRDNQGNDTSFDSLWRASMMAHSAKDPYWLATVGSETEEFPELEEAIGEKCSTCHMPLAHLDAQANEQTALILGDGFLNPANYRHDLAMDGVSCNLCHQITADNFDQPDSYSGGYLIDTVTRTWGERVAYGPFGIDPAYAQIMQTGSGYQAVQSEHITEAALCGTCHNLYTPYLDAANEIVGEFPEQTVYLEWQNSAFEESGACSTCHMPMVEDVQISNVAATTQAYLRMHTFTGANVFMLKMLQENAAEIGITAEDAQMQAAIDRVLAQLTATYDTVLQVGDVSLEDGMLNVAVTVNNVNGHKFPTAFPSRRVWLHVWITDANGETVFESGAVDADGRILGNDNDTDASLYEPHYDVISNPEEVQIYESIMQTTEDAVTTTLLKASGYVKDNRLLPAGFSLDGVDPDIAPYGQATADADFLAGGDTVHYQVDVGGAQGPFTVHFELYYQSIGYRWAENLRDYTNDQTQQFFTYYDAADKTPVLVGAAEVVAGE